MKKILIVFEIFGGIGFIANALIWLNLIPGYEFKKMLANSVQPQVYLFPAQQIRLTPGFVDGTQNSQVERAKWALKKNGSVAYAAEGLQPTVSIPPSEGGIYQLEVTLKLSEETEERSGITNIYVVQDKPEKIRTAQVTIIKKGTSGLSDKLLSAAQTNGVEIYDGSKTWKIIHDAKIDSTSITIPENIELANFQGQVIMRARGAEKDLSKYSTFATPPSSTIINASPAQFDK